MTTYAERAVHPMRARIAALGAAAVLVLVPCARAAGAQEAATAAQLAAGDSIFHGKLAGAVCYTCHGQQGKGIAGLGPDLRDATWLHGDGSVEFLARVIAAGVPKPKKSAVVMPPFGGAKLTPEEVRALAAYVHSLGAAK